MDIDYDVIPSGSRARRPRSPHRPRPKRQRESSASPRRRSVRPKRDQPSGKDKVKFSKPKMGEKSQPRASSNTTAIQSYFQIPAGNQGIVQLCTTILEMLRARETNIQVTLPQFQYVACLAYWNRLSQLSINLGYSIILEEAERLHMVTKGIKLPGILVTWLHSLGLVDLPSGTKVVPFIPTEDHEMFLKPLRFWTEGHPTGEPPAGAWTLDTAWVSHWNNHVVRGFSKDFNFSVVDYTLTSGKKEMLVSLYPIDLQVREDYNGHQVRGLSPCMLSVDETLNGACFFYRNYVQYANLPEDSTAELIFATEHGPNVDPRVRVSDIAAAMAPAVEKQ